MDIQNRSKLRVFLEDKLNIRIKPKPSKRSQIPIETGNKSLIDFLESLEGSDIINLSELEQFRTLSSDRETQYRIYDEMSVDSILSSALEMYADDATQYNSKGQIIWAESENQDISAFANRLIDILSLNKNAWSHIYSMVKYGDLYLETFKDDEKDNDNDPLMSKKLTYTNVEIDKNKKGAQLEEYIEAVSNPAEIFDITRRGKTVGFIKATTNDASPLEPRYNYQHIQVGEEVKVLPADKYVHICLAPNTDRFPEYITLSFDDSDNSSSNDNIKVYKYRINRGKSIFHDIYKTYRELKLMDDSLLLNRVTRSSIIRLLQVEVGDMPKTQVRELMKRIKNLIEQKNYLDKNDGTYTSLANPGPIDNVIYVPTRNGKGQISASNLGGDVDVKSISDIDYFKNKLYGGLKIPKQFLGDTDDPAGFSGGTSLTKLDSRYARTIKRIQNAYISGIQTLINIYALSKNLTDYVNNFTIKMVSPSTIEDQERDETLSNRLDMVSSFMSLISDDEYTDSDARKEIILYFINNYLNEPDVGEIVNKSKLEDTSEDNEEDDSSEDISIDFDTHYDTPSFDASTDIETSDFEDNNTDFDTSEEISSDEDFGDFSDEF